MNTNKLCYSRNSKTEIQFSVINAKIPKAIISILIVIAFYYFCNTNEKSFFNNKFCFYPYFLASLSVLPTNDNFFFMISFNYKSSIK